MDKYSKLMKGLEKCAGPECCKDGCPYYGETTGGMTCRARLLLDAGVAIVKEQGRAIAAEAERDALHTDVDDLEAATNTLRTERDGMRIELAKLAAENNTMHERCQVQQNEINALVLKLGKQEGETDRPSVCNAEIMEEVGRLIAEAKYQEGRADTLAEIVARCSFGGGGRHE